MHLLKITLTINSFKHLRPFQ